jgi:glycosyltransferase involved in cell wall biosynthesis
MLRVMGELRGHGIRPGVALRLGFRPAHGRPGPPPRPRPGLSSRVGTARSPRSGAVAGSCSVGPAAALRRVAWSQARRRRPRPRPHVRCLVGGRPRRSRGHPTCRQRAQPLPLARPGADRRDARGARSRRRLLRPGARRPRDGGRARPCARAARGHLSRRGNPGPSGARPPSPRIVFVGRLDRDKGPDILVEALGPLRDSPLTLILGDGRLRASPQRRVRELGLAKRVSLPDWVGDPAHTSPAPPCSRSDRATRPSRRRDHRARPRRARP